MEIRAPHALAPTSTFSVLYVESEFESRPNQGIRHLYKKITDVAGPMAHGLGCQFPGFQRGDVAW